MSKKRKRKNVERVSGHFPWEEPHPKPHKIGGGKGQPTFGGDYMLNRCLPGSFENGKRR